MFWRSSTDITEVASATPQVSSPEGKTQDQTVAASKQASQRTQRKAVANEEAQPKVEPVSSEAREKTSSSSEATTSSSTNVQAIPAAAIPVEPLPFDSSPASDHSAPALMAAPQPLPSPTEEQDNAIASVSDVQRSPFASPSPPVKESTPKPPTRTAALTPPAAAPAPSPDAPMARSLMRRQHLAPQTPSPAPPPPQSASGLETSAPAGANLSFLQWSSDPERRIAFLRVNGGPLTMAHEGDTVGGYTVVEIRQNAVELRLGESQMTLHAR